MFMLHTSSKQQKCVKGQKLQCVVKVSSVEEICEKYLENVNIGNAVNKIHLKV